jgi:hypothetical protein
MRGPRGGGNKGLDFSHPEMPEDFFAVFTQRSANPSNFARLSCDSWKNILLS